MMRIGLVPAAARSTDAQACATSCPDVAADRTIAPSPCDGAIAAPASAASAGIHPDRLERAMAATALVVRRHALMPRPGGFWIEALPRTVLSRGGGTLPGIAGSGTAFLVTPRHVVTAAHVVDRSWIAKSAFVFDYVPACLRHAEGNLPLRYEFAEMSVMFGVSVVDPDAVARTDDISVVELAGPAQRCGIAVAPLHAMAPGQPVAMPGCARMEPVSVAAATGRGPPFRVLSFDARLVRTSVRAFPGNSGSPLLNAHGDVLGVHTGMVYDRSSRSGGVPCGADSGVAAASAIRLRRIRTTLESIGADIRA